MSSSNRPPSPSSDSSDNETNSSNNSSSNSNSSNSSSSNNSSSNNSSSNNTDISYNVTVNSQVSYTVTDISYNEQTEYDASGNVIHTDCSDNFIIPTIIDFSLNQIIDGSGYQITYQDGFTIDGSNVAITQFDTTDSSFLLQITQDLIQVEETFDDLLNDSSNNIILNQIKFYANEIKCEDFHGKGSIDDYTKLFDAASKIAKESKQMQLDIDIDGFNEFGQAAEDLSKIFNGFIMKLENVNIINDYTFLISISNALSKIVNLSKIFNKFKATILATSTIQMPKSAHDTKVVIEGVMDEINCAMQYINHFVDASFNNPPGCELSTAEKNVIDKAVATIDNWNILCEQGVKVSLQNDPDIQFITQASTELITTTNVLKTATNKLKTKLASFNYC